jgi:Domain of unknown function (DUF4082)/Bacterial Ig-like domain
LTISRGQFLRRVGGSVATVAIGRAALADSALAAGGAAPTGLTALALSSRVVLAWQPVSGATSYQVFRGSGSGQPTTQLGSANATTFTDGSAGNGSTYTYAVTAVTGGAQSAQSNWAQATPGAMSGGNAIASENSFPGSTGWKLQGSAQAPTGIEGFATATSINGGGSVDLKITSDDGIPFHIEIYRMGYYGGAQGRLISVLPGLTGVDQDNPQKDPDLGLIDASNWTVSATISTTSDWPTGVYLLRLVRDDNTFDNHIILVVRNDGAAADIVYGLPVTTYQAYNDWGGRSLYTFNSAGGNTEAGTPRAVKVSFDRPYNQSLDGQRNWFVNCDIQDLSWLEQEGYNVTYVTNIDVHTGTQLSGRSAFVSPAHDEYWSSEMRSAVTNARDGGVGLFFMGANCVYWRIRFEPNPYSGVANRVQVCYKTAESGGPDPSGPTSTWRDPNGPNQPENALVGQMYIGDNGNIFFPLVVSAAQAQNRIWRYTTLQTLAPGTTARIGQYLVGWEWDGRFNNGAEPAGVTNVAASPVNGELMQDAGSIFINGPATTTATVYKAPSGAWVFSTGTNQWARGLGLNMNGVGEPSNFIKQATVNMLQDMGARPTTPEAAIVLDKLGPPQVASTTPANGDTNGSITTIKAVFDRTLDPATINAQSFTLSGPNGPVAATVAYNESNTNHVATLTPNQPLTVGTQYTAQLTTAIAAIDGSNLSAAFNWSFTTVSGPFSLFATSLTPVQTHLPVKDGRAGSGPFSYEMGVKISVLSPLQIAAVRFYKDPGETGTHIGRVWNAAGQTIGQTTFSGESASGWQQQSFATPIALQPGQVYVVSVGFNAFFSMTQQGLATQITSGALQSVADGKNGVFGSAIGVFPTTTYKSSNYMVDLVAQ